MAKIIKTSYSSKYRELAEIAREHGEANDCTVKALSVVCNVPYSVAHAAMARAGRVRGRGCYMETTMVLAAGELGFRMYRAPWQMMHDIIARYPRKDHCLQHLTTHHPIRFWRAWRDLPPMLLQVRGHVAVFRDGHLHDWAQNHARRVIQIWMVEPLQS